MENYLYGNMKELIMKLNKKGMAIVPFIFFISLFIFCLIYSSFRLKDLGLLDPIWRWDGPEINTSEL